MEEYILSEISEIWKQETYTFAIGQLRLRKVCVQAEDTGGAETFDYGDGSYDRIYNEGHPAVYEYEHLEKIEIDNSSGMLFGYTNWGAVYEIVEYSLPACEDGQKRLEVHYIVDKNVNVGSHEKVITAYSTENQLKILTKKTPGHFSALLGRGKDALIVRSYSKDGLGISLEKKEICEDQYQFLSRKESILSKQVMVHPEKVYVTTKNGVYKLCNGRNWVPPTRQSTDSSIIKYIAISENGLLKLEIRGDKNNGKYICKFIDDEKNNSVILKVQRIPRSFSANRVYISQNGSIGLITVKQNVAEIWDLCSRKHLRDVKGNDFLLSHNGEILLSEEKGIINLFDVSSGELLNRLHYDGMKKIDSMDISRDGKTVVASGGDMVCYWKVK